MCTKIYLVTRSTRNTSLKKSSEEFRAFESFADASGFLYDCTSKLVESGYHSIRPRKQNVVGMVTLQSLSFAKQCVSVHLTIQQIFLISKSPI